MKLFIVSCVFSPEPIVSALTSRDLAQELVNQGHRAQVITTFPNRPAGRLYESYRRRLWSCEHSASGYEILRIFSSFSAESRMVSRFLENFSFGIASALATLF